MTRYKKPLLSKSVYKKKFRNRRLRRKIRTKKQMETGRSIFQIGFLVSTGLFLLYGFYFFAVKSSFFRISDVSIVGAKHFVNAADLHALVADRVFGNNIFFVSMDDISQDLLKTFRGAKDIKITRSFPKTVIVHVRERIPLVLIFNDARLEHFMIDEDGYVLGIVAPAQTNFPRVHYTGDIKVGSFIDRALVPVYLEFTQALDASEVLASSMSFHPRYTALYLEDGIEVLVGYDKDVLLAIDAITTLETQLSEEGTSVKRIDLRYDKVVVSY